MIKFKELIPGKIYSLHSVRFNAMNVCRMICFDTTDLKRPISYWQFAERGAPILTEAKLRQMFDADKATTGVFAMWDWEFTIGSYEITEVKKNHDKKQSEASPLKDKSQLPLFKP